MKKYIMKSASETIKLGVRFAGKLRKGDCVCLSGELGSGKTTFVKGVARGLGIRKRIISPSYVLVHEYPEKSLVHIDLYRIDEIDFYESGLDQYLSKDKICIIEWAERAKSILRKNCKSVKFNMIDENTREIIFLK